MRAHIKQRCEAIVAAVQQREAELLAECDTLLDAKASRLLEQREGLQTSLEAMQAGCALARDAIERGAADPARTLYAREQLVSEDNCGHIADFQLTVRNGEFRTVN